MTESAQPIPPETEEALCLYVLDMLPEDERVAMEARLAAEPALRRSARELQETLDGCAQSVPQRPAPLRVWGRIAATISSAEAPVFATDSTQVERPGSIGWNRNQSWGWQALGAAACFAAGIGLHAMWSSFLPNSNAARSALVAGKAESTTHRPDGSVGALPQPGTHGAEHANAAESTASGKPGAGSGNTLAASGSDSGHAASAAANRPQERALQTQVAVLTELLNRELGTPPGTARLQVVRLVGPGESAETTATTAVHPDTLAALALTLLNPPGARGTTANTTVATTTGAPASATSATTPGGNGTPASAPAPTAAESVGTGTANFNTVGAATDSADLAGSSAVLSTPVVQVKLNDTTTQDPNATARSAGSSEKSAVATGTIPVAQTPSTALAQGAIPSTSTAGTGSLVAATPSGPSGVLLMLPNESAGTAVISNPTPLSASEVYQFWQTDPKTGQAVNLGTARSDASTAIFNFALTSGSTGISSVFITREPTGGSATPTGPVVVSTPAPKP